MINFDIVRHLIFDLDGTLIDSSRGVAEATNYALEKIGDKPRPVEEIAGYIGNPLEEMFRDFSDGFYPEFWKHFQEIGEKVIADSAEPIGNASKVLSQLKNRGYLIGIGTTKMRIHVSKILRNLGWEDYVDTYVGADDVKRVKPSPDCFIETMSRLGAEIETSLVIGDTVNDVSAAKAAGIMVVGVKSIFGREDELMRSNPDLIIDRIDTLLEYLK